MGKAEQYTKFAQGIFIVKSKNSAFNNDFSGLPRRLPDENGTIYATDKALKYCIRKYLIDKSKEPVFVWRRYKDDGKPMNINENYNYLFKDSIKKEKKEKTLDKKEIIKNLCKAIDVRLFGVTYAGETNISITGPVQLSYGINKFSENLFYNNDILSPYQDIKKETAEQQTIGNETKTLEAHYVYDFVINPNNLIDDLEFLKKEKRENLVLTEHDVSKFKEAVCKGVNYVNSTTKIGSEGELLLFIELKTEKDKENKKLKGTFLPLLKDLVKIEKEENNKTKIDLSGVFNLLDGYKSQIEKIEIYYNPSLSEISGLSEKNELNIEKFDIITLGEIEKETA